MEEHLSKEEFKKLFCYYFLKLRNVREAAKKAGIDDKKAFIAGMQLLNSQATKKTLMKISDNTAFDNGIVRAGLERLAFGDINDVIKLAFSEDSMTENEISSLDLYNVSEIKKVKGGGIEIKLFDRQKALEKLWEIENTADINSSAESFFNAIKAGADALQKTDAGED